MGTLSEHAIRNNYKGACQALDGQLANLSQSDVKGRLILAVNAALLASNVPTVGLRDDPSSGANAYFDFATWSIVFGGPLNGSRTLTQKFFVRCANTVYHEARHCEQWYRMAQAVARGFDHISNQDLLLAFNYESIYAHSKQDISKAFKNEIRRDAAAINTYMGIHLSAAAAAVANPNYAPVSKNDIGKWWRSIYAVGRTGRGTVLEHLGTTAEEYLKYRNLPEEVDAWRLGDGLGEELKQAIGVRDDRPSYRDWKILTKGKWFQTRSSNLKELDSAYEQYERTRSAGDKTALATAFTTWYGPKGGSTIRNQLDDDGVGVVDQLKRFLGA